MIELVILCFPVLGAVEVSLDTSEIPELADWGQQAKELCEQWHPRLCHLLADKNHQSPQTVQIVFKKSDRGIADTSGNRIRVYSDWVEKHPDDIGLVFHELVHVIQGYGPTRQSWLTEGIADYLRWAIYEGKPQAWFPVPDDPKGYRQGYRVCAGFLTWLESDRAPGIVKKLNVALRRSQYTDGIFEAEAGAALDELWTDYIQEHKAMKAEQ